MYFKAGPVSRPILERNGGGGTHYFSQYGCKFHQCVACIDEFYLERVMAFLIECKDI